MVTMKNSFAALSNQADYVWGTRYDVNNIGDTSKINKTHGDA